MATILLTGSTGFNGKNLVGPILNSKHDLICLIFPESKKDDINFVKEHNPKIVLGDLRDYDHLVVATKGIDVIIHAGAIVPGQDSNENMFQVNVEGTKNLIKAAKKNKVKKIVFYSSTSVYGECFDVDESADVDGFGPYEASKLEAEKIIENSEIDYTIFRTGLVFGRFNFRLKKLVDMIDKNKFWVVGSGQNLMQPLYIEDYVKIVLKEVNDLKGKGIVNVAGDKKIKSLDFYRRIAKILDTKAEPKVKIPKHLAYLIENFVSKLKIKSILTKDALDFQTQNRTFDISKLKNNYKIKFTRLDDSLPKFIKWAKNAV